MQKIKNLIYLAILIVLIVSCKTTGEQTYYDNGNLKSDFIYLDSTQGVYTKYYITGEKEKTVESKNRIKNGKEIGYYKNGNISYVGFYSDGEKDGIFEFYDKGGEIKSRVSFFEGVKMFDEFNYNELGNLLSYKFNDYHEVPVFEAQYQNNKFKNSNGTPFFIVYDFHGESFVKDSLEIIIMAPLDSLFDLSLDVQVLDSDSKSLIAKKHVFERDSFRRFSVIDVDVSETPVFVIVTYYSDSLMIKKTTETLQIN